MVLLKGNAGLFTHHTGRPITETPGTWQGKRVIIRRQSDDKMRVKTQNHFLEWEKVRVFIWGFT